MARTTDEPRKMVCFRLTERTINRIDELAKKMELSKADIIQLAVKKLTGEVS